MQWPLGKSVDARVPKTRLQRQKEMESWVGVHEFKTKLLPLGNMLFAKVDDEDFDVLNQYNWSFGSGYVQRTHFETRATVKLHRLVMGMSDSNIHLDHRNRDTLDNRKHNLRPCDVRHNTANAPKKRGANPFKGVFSHHTGKWRAQIMVHRKTISLGLFWSPIEAVAAYNLAAQKHFGEFALLNEIPHDFNESEMLPDKCGILKRVINALRDNPMQSTAELAEMMDVKNLKSASCLIRQVADICPGKLWKLKETLPQVFSYDPPLLQRPQ